MGRGAAFGRMSQALADFEVAGVTTNLGFLETLVAHPAIRANRIDTSFIEGELGGPAPGRPVLAMAEMAAAVAAFLIRKAAAVQADPADPWLPWDARSNWMPAGERRRVIAFHDAEGRVHTATVRSTRDGTVLEAAGQERRFVHEARTGSAMDVNPGRRQGPRKRGMGRAGTDAEDAGAPAWPELPRFV